MNSLEDFIKNENVALYGYKEKHLPDILSKKKKGWTKIFIKKDKDNTIPKDCSFSVSFYKNIRHIKWHAGELCFLDNEAVKALIVGFPFSKYVLVRVSLFTLKYWLIAFLGLIRRVIFHKQVRIRRIIKLSSNKRSSWWLALERPKKYRASLSKGKIQTLLDYLKKEKVNYVVLRFFDKLPKLSREKGDLDILVADEDEFRVNDFIHKHFKNIPIEIQSVSSPKYYGIPYFSPPLAKKILESAIEGPAGFHVPSPKETFLGLIYHVLYHRSEGTYAGIPSQLPEIKVNLCPNHNYRDILTHMAKDLNINISIDMESLDNYLAREGWRPNLDTLTKIAEWNEWVYQRFFSKPKSQEIILAVFIFKEKVFQLDLVNSIISVIKKDGFVIVRKKRLEDAEQNYVAERLRGGTWLKEKPAMALVVLDLHSLYFKKQNKFFWGQSRFRILKERLRGAFGKDGIHSTDNTEEAWQYIKICFPSEIVAIKKEIKDFCKNYRLSVKEKIKANLKMLPYYKKGMTVKAKNSIINFLIK